MTKLTLSRSYKASNDLLAHPFSISIFKTSFVMAIFIGSTVAFGSVEGSLQAIQNKLINVILPLVGILGLVFAAFSFFTGSPNARSHLVLAIFGAVVGFGAPSIIDFIRGLVN